MVKSENNIGIALNYILIIITNLSSIILAPRLIHGMGEEIYGIYIVVFQIMTFFAVADFGMGTTVIRNIVKYNVNKNNKDRDNYIFWTALTYLLFVLVVLLVSVIFYAFSPLVFANTFSAANLKLFKLMFLIMVLNCIFLFAQNFLFAVIAGFEKFTYTRVCQIVKIIIRTALFIALVFTEYNPVYLFLVDLVLNILIIIFYAVYAFRLGVRPKPYKRSRIAILDNLKNMFWLYIMPVSENSFWAVCNVLIAATINSESVTVFSLAVTFCLIFQQIIATLSYFKMPVVTKHWITQENGPEFTQYVHESSHMQAALSGAVLIGYIVFGKAFLTLWVGADFSITYFLGVWMMSAMFFPMTQSMLEAVLYARNKYFLRAVVFISSTVFNSVLSFFFLKWFGIIGGACAVAISTLLFKLIVMDVYFVKIGINIKLFIIDITGKILLFAAPLAIAGFAVVYLTESLLIQVIAGFVIFFVYLLSVYKFYLPKSQRIYLKSLFLRK